MLEKFNFKTGPRACTRTELIAISVVFFSLPLYEFLKNTFSIGFILYWIFVAFKSRSLGLSCEFNWRILCLALILWIAPVFSNLEGVIPPVESAPRWTILALFVSLVARLNFSKSQVIVLYAALLIGGSLSVAEAFWAWSLNDSQYPELRSVGAVNHSSMYTMVVLAVALSAITSRVNMLVLFGVCGTIATLWYLPPSKSSVGLVTSVVLFTCFMAIYFAKYIQKVNLFIVSLICILLSLSLAAFAGGGLWDEFVYRLTSSNPLNGRLQYIIISVEVFDRNPLFGTGWFSFQQATSLEILREEMGVFRSSIYQRYAGHPHGHNLWATVLVERGLVGVFLVASLLFGYFRYFVNALQRFNKFLPFELAVSLGGFLIVVEIFISGLGNTSMINEHGQAGMAFISVIYGYLRGARKRDDSLSGTR